MTDWPLWYGLDHQPIGMEEANRLLVDMPARRVAVTQVGPYMVSTVFLVFDHNFGGGGPPVLYETMVFGGGDDEPQWRYLTREAAAAGHERAVAELREALPNGASALAADPLLDAMRWTPDA
jgi:hypothetical protein